ncbi:MAG: trigger factor [Candidatus Curtissbacteria bacterium]|nr:trigger factor [Candidatus Curtissbacteria bacterium]
MQYTVNRLEKGKVEVKVDVPKAGFEETYGQTVQAFKKSANIAGFRPGMAPDDMVVGNVGANKVLNETASFLISKHLGDIFKKEDLVPLDSPKIAVDSLAAASPFSFTASFTLRPQIKVGDWKKIKVKKVKTREVTAKDIEESIKNIFEAYRKQKETKVTKEPEEPKEESVIYDAKGNPIKSKSEVPPEGRAGKVESGSPSAGAQDEIDDNFAKAIGARDLAHLHEIIKKDLETLVADQVESQAEQEIFEEILKLGEIEVPEILVEDELNRILIRMNSELEKQGRTLESYLDSEKTTIDALKAKWREQATKNVKISLVMDTIGREEKVQVTKEELEAALAGVNQTNLSADQKRDLENYLVTSIFQAKTLDLVKKTVAA